MFYLEFLSSCLNSKQESMIKNVLVLGGEGFLGLNIMRHLSQSLDCTSVDIKKSPFYYSSHEVVELDPYCDSIGGQYDVAIHCIDHVLAPALFELAEKTLMEKLLQTGVSTIVLLSSSIIYADPKSVYGERKMLFEKMYANFCKAHGVSLIVLRVFNTYGPFQMPYRSGSLVANLIYNHLRQEPTEIKDMSAKRDFIYSEDIPKFVEYAVRNQMEGTFDVGSGMLVSVGELISILEEDIFRSKIRLVKNGVLEDMDCPVAQKNEFDSIRLTDLREGLVQTANFYKDHMEVITSYVKRKTA